MRVQVFTSLIVLEANLVATFHRLARPARFSEGFGLSNSEERCLIILALVTKGDNLLSTSTTIVGTH